MISFAEIQYHLNLLKKELEKKEFAEYHTVLPVITKILTEPVKLENILEQLKQICEKAPKNYWAKSLLAFFYKISFHISNNYYPDQIIETLCQEALQLKPDFVFALYVLGGYYATPCFNSMVYMYKMVSREKGEQYLQKAAKLGYLPAQYEYEQLLYGLDEHNSDGENIHYKDFGKLKDSVQKMAVAGYPAAQIKFCSGIFDSSHNKVHAEDEKMYAECLIGASLAGDKGSQYRLGKCYATGTYLKQDFEKAIYWFQLCEKNILSGTNHVQVGILFYLAGIYATPNSKLYDPIKALDYYEKAQKQGLEHKQKKDNVMRNWSPGSYREIFIGPSRSVSGGNYYAEETLKQILEACALKIQEIDTHLKKVCFFQFKKTTRIPLDPMLMIYDFAFAKPSPSLIKGSSIKH